MARRYTFDVGEKVDKLLSELAEEEGLTKAEVIRRAVATYDYLKKETGKDKVKVSLSDHNNNVVKDVILP